MIGYYNYTMLLTYMSLLSASVGIGVSLYGSGHPYIGIFFLMFCGLCDAFDGKVAKMKKDRSPMECKYGIQVDSLSDVVAFGVLPACIGFARFKNSTFFDEIGVKMGNWKVIPFGLVMAVLLFYILTAMIRLAYFNVTEEERQKTETGTRKYYTGLPVTSAAVIFPIVALIQYLLPKDTDISLAYFITTAVMAIAFVSKIQIRKPGIRGIMAMVGIGILEFATILVMTLCT